MLNGLGIIFGGGTLPFRRSTLRLGLVGAACGMVYAQVFYRFHLWDKGTFPQLVLLGSAITAGMTWLLVRRAQHGMIVLWLLVAGFVGISLGVIIDVTVSPISQTGGERNLFPFEIALLTIFGLPGAVVGSVLGWTTRLRGSQ